MASLSKFKDIYIHWIHVSLTTHAVAIRYVTLVNAQQVERKVKLSSTTIQIKVFYWILIIKTRLKNYA